MGADTKKLRNRIKSVNSTLHLTKAMGLVASSKIRKATEAMQKSREYATSVCDMVDKLSSYDECRKSPYMRNDSGERIRFVVVAGDRGLAGGYNANVFRIVRDYPDAQIFPIGKRACERFDGEVQSAEHFGYAQAIQLANTLCEDFCKGEYDKLGIVCTKYHSMMSQEAYIRWVLPIERKESKSVGIIFEPDELTVLNAAIPEYVAGVVIAAVRESFASEVASRRFAMDSAGKNAQKMIDDLGLEYNRARQGAITQEITEIVAGSGS